MFIISFVIGAKLMKWICQREQIEYEKLDRLLCYVIAGTIIGARLGHSLFYEPTYFLANLVEILKVWHGGLASHGGALGVLLSVFIFSKKYPQFSFAWILDWKRRFEVGPKKPCQGHFFQDFGNRKIGF